MKVKHRRSGKQGEIIDRKITGGKEMVRVHYESGHKVWGLAENYEMIPEETPVFYPPVSLDGAKPDPTLVSQTIPCMMRTLSRPRSAFGAIFKAFWPEHETKQWKLCPSCGGTGEKPLSRFGSTECLTCAPWRYFAKGVIPAEVRVSRNASGQVVLSEGRKPPAPDDCTPIDLEDFLTLDGVIPPEEVWG